MSLPCSTGCRPADCLPACMPAWPAVLFRMPRVTEGCPSGLVRAASEERISFRSVSFSTCSLSDRRLLLGCRRAAPRRAVVIINQWRRFIPLGKKKTSKISTQAAVRLSACVSETPCHAVSGYPPEQLSGNWRQHDTTSCWTTSKLQQRYNITRSVIEVSE